MIKALADRLAEALADPDGQIVDVALRALGVVGTQPDRMIGGFMAADSLGANPKANAPKKVIKIPACGLRSALLP